MSLSEEKKVLLSQLVDGELPADEANRMLGEMLDELAPALGDSETGMQLRAMLELRKTLDPWRQQEPPEAIVALPPPRARDRTSHAAWRLVSLASAALLGGVLVAGGFFLHDRLRLERPAAFVMHQPAFIVTPEQRREIARAFALHESVAGPLSWYAADDTTIQVAPAEPGEAMRQPIAVVLRLTRAGPTPSGTPPVAKTYVIVCRNDDAAAIRLPPSAMARNLRLRLLSTETNGQVELQYVLAADDLTRGLEDAALMGRRNVGLRQTSLGQLALNDCLVNVDAGAWVIRRHAQ